MNNTAFSPIYETGYEEWITELSDCRNAMFIMETMLKEMKITRKETPVVNKVEHFKNSLHLQYEEALFLEKCLGGHREVYHTPGINPIQKSMNYFLSDSSRIIRFKEMFFDLRKQIFEFLACFIGAPAGIRETYTIF